MNTLLVTGLLFLLPCFNDPFAYADYWSSCWRSRLYSLFPRLMIYLHILCCSVQLRKNDKTKKLNQKHITFYLKVHYSLEVIQFWFSHLLIHGNMLTKRPDVFVPDSSPKVQKSKLSSASRDCTVHVYLELFNLILINTVEGSTIQACSGLFF